MSFRRDSRGIAQLLKSPAMRELVDEAAKSVASEARSRTDLPVDVNSYTTDRAAASVAIAHPAGAAAQARDGVLTQAAEAAGLEVGGR